MPIYEYRCQTCQEVTEALVRSGKEPTACPNCGDESLTRLISRAGIIFKGSGFYVNDSKGSKASNTGSSDSGKSDSGSGKDSNSSKASPPSDSGSSAKSSDSTSSSSD